MGLLTPRGEEDDEQGDISDRRARRPGRRMATTRSPTSSTSGARPTAPCSRDRLETLGAPHTWEGTTLVVASRRRGLGGADHGSGRRGPVGARPRTRRRRAGRLRPDRVGRRQLRPRCSTRSPTEAIPYGLDGDELFVGASDEARVDEIVAALTTPGATLTARRPGQLRGHERAVRRRRRAQPRPRRPRAPPRRSSQAPGPPPAPRALRHRPGVVGRRGRQRRRAGRPRRVADRPTTSRWSSLATDLRAELRPFI